MKLGQLPLTPIPQIMKILSSKQSPTAQMGTYLRNEEGKEDYDTRPLGSVFQMVTMWLLPTYHQKYPLEQNNTSFKQT